MVPTLCLIIQEPSAMCGMSLSMWLRVCVEPVMYLGWGQGAREGVRHEDKRQPGRNASKGQSTGQGAPCSVRSERGCAQ